MPSLSFNAIAAPVAPVMYWVRSTRSCSVASNSRVAIAGKELPPSSRNEEADVDFCSSLFPSAASGWDSTPSFSASPLAASLIAAGPGAVARKSASWDSNGEQLPPAIGYWSIPNLTWSCPQCYPDPVAIVAHGSQTFAHLNGVSLPEEQTVKTEYRTKVSGTRTPESRARRTLPAPPPNSMLTMQRQTRHAH